MQLIIPFQLNSEYHFVLMCQSSKYKILIASNNIKQRRKIIKNMELILNGGTCMGQMIVLNLINTWLK